MKSKKRFSTKLMLITGLISALVLAAAFSNELLAAFGAMNGVKTMVPSELEKLMTEQDALLVDVREKKEYEVSHLKGAVWADDLDTAGLDKNRLIVLYCTIGFRSTEFGATLSKKGFHNIYNLDGGIFRWKNEKRIVFNQADQPTDSVHVYSDMFGFLLREGIKVE